MKLSIRLQNHGCRNHPYWWIVVAPNRKNIKGRFIEHVGYWAPREGQNVDRQITLNLPRIKYWMGNGAVPTPRIQKFLSIWQIMPRPFYVEKQRVVKPQEQMTEEERRKEARKQKKKERIKLHYTNYKKYLAQYKSYQTKSYHGQELKLREKIYAAERENQILRELLLHHEYIKINRINELAGNAVLDDTEELLRLEGELKKAKSELALLDKNIKGTSPMQKIKVIKEINALVDRIREVQKQREPFRLRNKEVTEGENVTKDQIDREIEYELITKKIEKMNKQMQILDKLSEVVTLEEYANYLQKQEPELSPEDALTLAQEIFIERGQKRMPPLTRYEIYYKDELTLDPKQIMEYDQEVIFNTFSDKAATQVHEDEEGEEQKQEEQRQEVHEQGQEEGGENQQNEDNKQEHQQVEELAAEGQNQRGQQAARRWGQQEYDTEEEQIAELYRKVGYQMGIDLQAEDAAIKKVHQKDLVKFLLNRPDVMVPTNRPVHPFPDLETYIPEEYYEPISDLNLKVVHLDSLEPNDELVKYHQKRQYASNKSSKGLKSAKKANRGKQTV